MNADRLVDLRGNAIADDRVTRFRGRIRGETIGSGDPPYDAARRIWNASVDRHPGLILRCQGVADVVAALAFARDNDIAVAIRGGGHNVGGRALCDGGLVIDFARMKGVHVDPARRTVRVQPGATLGDLDAETHLHGLAVPVGVVSKTGVAGLTLGGGVGWLVGKYGMTCDNVLSFDLVTADGTLLTASADENADLFWALRGGGGNFGVVTSFQYRAHPVHTVLGGVVVYPRAKAGEVLRFYRDAAPAAPDELTAFAALTHTPDGTPAVAVIACYCGAPAAGERLVEAYRKLAQPLLDTIGPIPFPQMQAMFDDSYPAGNHNYWKSSYVRDLSDGLIDTLIAHAATAPSRLTGVVAEYYGGAARRVDAGATAFAHRTAGFDVGMLTQWTDPAQSQANIAWTRALYDALQPHASGAYLLNFLDQEADTTIRAAFGQNYPRLARIKARYDPGNFFRLNQNIQPAA